MKPTYRIIRLLARGGMSEVYLAQDKRSGRAVAVKKGTFTEAQILAGLDHPAIVQLLDSFEDKDGIWIVEEYVPGRTLSAYCSGSSLPSFDQRIELAFSVGEQICDALCYLHERKPPVIYRDLKPANIILKPDGAVKLIDFGIAREYVPRENEDTTNFGTVGYAAPEQYAESFSQTDGRSDIYGFGKLLYFILTGEQPEDLPEQEWKNEVKRKVPDAPLAALIIKCTRDDPEKRCRSADELYYELQKAEDTEEDYERSTGDMEDIDELEMNQKRKKRKRIPVNPSALALTILALFVYAGGFLLGLGEGFAGVDRGWENFRLFPSVIYWGAAFAGGTLIMGFAQIVKLLHEIRQELKNRL